MIQSDFLGWLSDPFKGLSDLQLGDQKVTLNHLLQSLSKFFTNAPKFDEWNLKIGEQNLHPKGSKNKLIFQLPFFRFEPLNFRGVKRFLLALPSNQPVPLRL